MRICVLLPRFSPGANSPIAQVVRKFSNNYQVGLATVASALSQGHQVNCVLVGPDPSKTEASSSIPPLDPALEFLQGAFPNKMSIGLAEPPRVDEVLNFIDGISDPRGGRHWAQAINGAAAAGCHVIVDALGAEVCGGCKYLLDAPEFNENERSNSSSYYSAGDAGDGDSSSNAGSSAAATSDTPRSDNDATRARSILGASNSGHMWSRYDFPDSETLVRSIAHVYASNQLVSALNQTEALLRRAPEPSVIPPSVRDKSKASLPLHLQAANTAETDAGAPRRLAEETNLERRRQRELAEKQERMLRQHRGEMSSSSSASAGDDLGDAQEDAPEDTLIVSLTSWRLLSLAEWHVKRVLWLPGYDGGERSEVCVAATEDTYRYFREMFKQTTFDDFCFLGVPPLLREGVAEHAKSAAELRRLCDMRPRYMRLGLQKEHLPFDVFRISGLLPTRAQSLALGVAAATSNAPGFSSYLSADELGDTIVAEVEQYVEDDRELRTSGMFKVREVVAERRNKAKMQADKLRLASKLRFGFRGVDDEEGLHKADVAVKNRSNPLALLKHALMLQRMYSTFP